MGTPLPAFSPELCEELDGVFYPFAEEEPLVQGDRHFRSVGDLNAMASELLHSWERVGIYSDIFIYYEEGNPQRVVGPGLIVLPEVIKPMERQSLYLWQQPSRPIFVGEVLSRETARQDQTVKLRRYERDLRIPEYFLYDAREGKYMAAGFRLFEQSYRIVEPDARGWLWSEQLSAWFGLNDAGEIQLWDASGVPVPRYRELRQQREQAIREREAAEREREAAERARDAALLRISGLEDQLRRLSEPST